MATKVEIKLTRREVRDVLAGLDRAIGRMLELFELLRGDDLDLLQRLEEVVPKIKKQVD